MAQVSAATSGAGAIGEFEAAVRAKARPMIPPEERAKVAREKAALECRMAAERCRAAAAVQIAKAEAFEAQAKEIEK